MKQFWLVCMMVASVSGFATELFVAPDGSDVNSGALAHPFASLEKARDVARAIHDAKPAEPVTIFVRGGMYSFARPLKLGAQDSATTWRAYQNEKPHLLGGRLIGNFVQYEKGILRANVGAQGFKGINFRQLFFDGKRQHRARYPNFDANNPYGGGWAYAAGKPFSMYTDRPDEDKHTLHFKPSDARTWVHPEDGEVMVFPRHNWWNNIVRIESVNSRAHILTLAKDCSYAIRPLDRYYVQGLFEELDAPGEWFLDSRTQTLYFWPPAPLAGKPVYAPTMRTILDIGAGTHDVIFRGFTFECAEGTAITLKDTTNCLIVASTIHNVGDYGGNGVAINSGQNNGVTGCDIYEIGRCGVSLAGGDRITLTSAGNFADNNYIHHIGVFYGQGVGVDMSGCGNRASHNLIHDGPRMGIHFAGNNHIIEYNHIRHMNLETEDTGAVYTGGRDWLGARGSVIRYNYFHDMLGYGHDDKGVWHSPYFAWGVYLDDNTGGVDVIGNIVARCSRAGLHLHNGRDNHVENNIFVEGRLQQVEYSGWTETSRMWHDHFPTMVTGYESVAGQPAWQKMRHMELHPKDAILPDHTIMAGNVLTRNIIYYTDPKAKLYQMRSVSFAHNICDSNVIWHSGLPLQTGQQQIKDAHGPNLAPNPGFAEGEAGALPKYWKWQVRPNASRAALDTTIRAAGKQALRIEGHGTTSDAMRQKLWPNFVSMEIPAKAGQAYRLTARIKAAAPGTKFAMMPQSYQHNMFFWSKDLGTTAGTDWKDYELIFKFPAPGDPQYKPGMKSFCIRFDVRQEAGTIWVDNVTLKAATVMDEWASWQTLGNDQHSLVADPLFVNAAQDDYRLKPDSPAFKLGFQPIPVEKIGPYQSELRASWPIVEAEGVREHPMAP